MPLKTVASVGIKAAFQKGGMVVAMLVNESM